MSIVYRKKIGLVPRMQRSSVRTLPRVRDTREARQTSSRLVDRDDLREQERRGVQLGLRRRLLARELGLVQLELFSDRLRD
ncbi:hypothetical protein GGD64_007310 [Bradyrhizobium sp. CIR3A]|nr:hypothetical protein [Bradyrhizobium sp. CIR3A]NYG49603.1 hypothetical protein [Bradyrhizobium sp. IAR9]